jgi:hypothetical protein
MVHQITSKVVNRALVGLPLCRNEEWFKTSLGYTIDAFTISGTLRPLPWFVRPFAYYKLDARKSLKRHLATAARLIAPIVEERQQKDSKRMDVIQWMVNNAKDDRDRQPAELAHKTLFLCLASIASSSMGVTHAIYDLCAMPEYTAPLREEIEKALAEHGGWTLAALNAMWKLDSFLKESQRISHPGLCKPSSSPFHQVANILNLLSFIQSQSRQAHHAIRWDQTSCWHIHLRAHLLHLARPRILSFPADVRRIPILKIARAQRRRCQSAPIHQHRTNKSRIWLRAQCLPGPYVCGVRDEDHPRVDVVDV